MMFSNLFTLHTLYPDAELSIEDYYEYTRQFAERLDKLGEDYSEQDRKRRKTTSKRKQAPSTLNSENLPDDIDHIHRAKAAMAARAYKEFTGPNDVELTDDEQTSELVKESQEQ
jgi:hypothetical protein